MLPNGEECQSMMYFACDLCGKTLVPGEDSRYVVKIEACAAPDPIELTEEDLAEDHMEAVSQLLREMEDGADDVDGDSSSKNFRFDLCPECHKRFVRDPLGKDHSHKLYFSKN
jgi:hypothetical protein